MYTSVLSACVFIQHAFVWCPQRPWELRCCVGFGSWTQGLWSNSQSALPFLSCKFSFFIHPLCPCPVLCILKPLETLSWFPVHCKNILISFLFLQLLPEHGMSLWPLPFAQVLLDLSKSLDANIILTGESRVQAWPLSWSWDLYVRSRLLSTSQLLFQVWILDHPSTTTLVCTFHCQSL